MRTDAIPPTDASFYPIFVSIRGKTCLVVGGGTVGERKTRGLLSHGALVHLVTRDLTPWLQLQLQTDGLKLIGSSYEESQLHEVDLVFAATSDLQLNRMIAKDAEKRRILCNMATEPELGGFIVPASFEQGPLSVAVSTSGLSPAIARKIRDQIRDYFGPVWASTLKALGRFRQAIQTKGLPSSENQRLFKELADLPLYDWLEMRQYELMLDAVHKICQPWLTMEELQQIMEESW